MNPFISTANQVLYLTKLFEFIAELLALNHVYSFARLVNEVGFKGVNKKVSHAIGRNNYNQK